MKQNKELLLCFLICFILCGVHLEAESFKQLSGWEYSWGDSGVNSSGIPGKVENKSEEIWHKTESLIDPPGRAGQEILWLRVRLQSEEIAEPSLFIDCVYQGFEVYQNDKLIYQYGISKDLKKTVYTGRPWHIVQLDKNYNDSFLYLRIHSFDSHIGIPGVIKLDSKSGHIIRILRKDFIRAAVSLLFMVTAIISIIIFFRGKNELSLIYFAVSLISITVWNISNSRIKLIYINKPFFWLYAEYTSLYLSPVLTGLFLEQLFKSGKTVIIRRGWQILLVFAVISLAAGIYEPYWLRTYTQHPFQIMLSVYFLLICIIIMRKAWLGDHNARIVSIGLAAAIILSLHDIFISFMGFSYRIDKISYWGLVIFIISLGSAFGRHLREIPLNVSDSSDLQKKAITSFLSKNENKKNDSKLNPEIAEKLKLAIEYINGNFTSDISREGLAQYVSLNHDYFSKMFYHYTGKKVRAYINDLRINRASELLISTELSIIDIAFSSGFESVSTFYRIFQDVTSISPTAYRDRSRSLDLTQSKK